MLLDPDHCYHALLSHDHRFDGQFYIGVTSTRVYCRPVCRVKTPKLANCRFYPSAAAAEAAGFRPCRRCRPELAPGKSAMDSAARLAILTARRIEAGDLSQMRLPELAAQLGVSDRHLRRVFQEEYGVSPNAYAQTQRLLLAKRLLTDSTLPVTEVALASGFGSLSRFNSLFRSCYRMAPSDLRQQPVQDTAPDAPLRFELSYRPPYDWATLRDFLSHRCIPGVEHWEGEVYRRSVRLEYQGQTHQGWLQVQPMPDRPSLLLQLGPGLARAIPPVLIRVRQLFDLCCNPDEIDAVLGTLAENRPGIRVPGSFDGFELAVRAILGQQVTVKAARTLVTRLVARLGDPLPDAGPVTHLFPSAATVAATAPEVLGELGILRRRSACLIALAEQVANGQLLLRPGGDLPRTLQQLQAIPGIGPWTAQYIAMRALSWPDAFPAADVGLYQALGCRDARQTEQISQAWRPWRAYAVMHLWHRHADH